jgi:DNA-directed RNA polymerase specialized sigma24 family protein
MELITHYDESLTVAHLRRWARDRQSLKAGRTGSYKSEGWKQRKATQFDAAVVHAIDFERALNELTAQQHVALVLCYRDGLDQHLIAQSLACSVRKVGYLIPEARHRLTQILHRLDLL